MENMRTTGLLWNRTEFHKCEAHENTCYCSKRRVYGGLRLAPNWSISSTWCMFHSFRTEQAPYWFQKAGRGCTYSNSYTEILAKLWDRLQVLQLPTVPAIYVPETKGEFRTSRRMAWCRFCNGSFLYRIIILC